MNKFFVIVFSLLFFSALGFANAEIIKPPEDVVIGKKNAPITVIEYSSYTCSHCATFHNTTFKKIKTNYIDIGKVKYIQRDFPLDQPSMQAAQLTRCTPKEKYSQISSVLFKKQKDWAYNKNWEKELRKILTASGMSPATITKCLENESLKTSVLQSRVEGAQQFEIRGTPTFIINGKVHKGTASYKYLSVLFDKIIDGSAK